MDKFLADRIQLTVDNYRLVKEELRNDGDIINHFASLIFSHYEREIPIYRVKEIRKNIKLNTTRISPFRGDTLNILSLLIATVDKEEEEELIQDIYDVMELLEGEGFTSGSYLVLTAFTISMHLPCCDILHMSFYKLVYFPLAYAMIDDHIDLTALEPLYTNVLLSIHLLLLVPRLMPHFCLYTYCTLQCF